MRSKCWLLWVCLVVSMGTLYASLGVQFSSPSLAEESLPTTVKSEGDVKTPPLQTPVPTSQESFLVYLPKSGLGNRFLTLVSAYLFSLLSHRTLVVRSLTKESEKLMTFVDRRVIVLEGESVYLAWRATYRNSSVYDLDIAFHKKSDRSRRQEWTRLLSQNLSEAYPQKILTVLSNQYYAPVFFANPWYQSHLRKVFRSSPLRPFYELSQRLWRPSAYVLQKVTSFYENKGLGNLSNYVGLQIRIFTHQYESASEAFESCLKKMALERIGWGGPIYLASMNARTRAWWKKRTAGSSTSVSWLVNMASEVQRTGETEHDVEAYAEMILLGQCGYGMVVSPYSTYGSVAAALAGVNPVQMNGCVRQTTSEPCFAIWGVKDRVGALAASLHGASSLRVPFLPETMLRVCS